MLNAAAHSNPQVQQKESFFTLKGSIEKPNRNRTTIAAREITGNSEMGQFSLWGSQKIVSSNFLGFFSRRKNMRCRSKKRGPQLFSGTNKNWTGNEIETVLLRFGNRSREREKKQGKRR